MRIHSEISFHFNKKKIGYFVSVADAIRRRSKVVRILNRLSLYAWSDFLFKIQEVLKTCCHALS